MRAEPEDLPSSLTQPPTGPPQLDGATVAALRAGEPDAVGAVYRAYRDLVLAVAYRVLGDHALAEEASQQAFVMAWRAAGPSTPTGPLGPWLAAIAQRAALDVRRREGLRADPLFGSRGPRPAPPVAVDVDVDRLCDVWTVRSAIGDLPDSERDVVRLQHFDGLTHGEIADRLAIPIGTVKSRSNRAHRRLAATLGHLRATAC